MYIILFMASKADTQVVRLSDKKDWIGKTINILGKLDFVFLLLFVATLVAGVLCVFIYKGDNYLLNFNITYTVVDNFTGGGGTQTRYDNGLIAIFCFIFAIIFFLVTIAETVLVIVSKKANLSKLSYVFIVLYVLLVLLSFLLVTIGLFPRLKLSTIMAAYLSNGKFDVGFYHYWGSDTANNQTLSLLGYFALIFGAGTVGAYFPYKKYCEGDFKLPSKKVNSK